MNYLDFQQLATIRLMEAEAQLATVPPLPSGAYYLGGYAVECALKACIAKRTQAGDWPDKRFALDVHTHDLLSLVKSARLDASLQVLETSNPIFRENWQKVRLWSEQSRYALMPYTTAMDLLEAVRSPQSGVLSWIIAHW